MQELVNFVTEWDKLKLESVAQPLRILILWNLVDVSSLKRVMEANLGLLDITVYGIFLCVFSCKSVTYVMLEDVRG
jgi:hypothetical protein